MTTTSRHTDTTRGPDCDAIAPLLALRDTGLLDVGETARVENHLATCDVCQGDAELDSAIVGSLRRALLAPSGGARTLTVDDVRRFTQERVAATPISDAPEARPAPEWRGDPPRFPAARWGSGLSALAAVLALMLFATYIFGTVSTGIRRTTWPGPTPALSPLLDQQTVYLPTGAGVFALRASDGAVRWTYPGGIEKTPVTQWRDVLGLALDHGTLYALCRSPDAQGSITLLALDARDGAVRWSKSLPTTISSLLQVGNLLIVAAPGPVAHGTPSAMPASGQAVEAVSAATGGLVWRHPLEETALSNPVAANGVIYIGTTGHVIALGATDGKQRWSTPIIPGATQQGTTFENVNTSVALAATSDTIYVLAKRKMSQGSATTWEDSVYAVAASDGSHLWLSSVENDSSATAFPPTLASGVVYVPFFGGLVAFPHTPGGDFSWRFIPNDTSGGVIMTGAAVADGVVYTTDLSGVLANTNGTTHWENFTYAVRASDGVELWRSPTNGGLNAASPVVASGMVFAPSIGVVRALRASDGRQMWMYVLPSGDRIGDPIIG
jgi:outer membrane protein assembly factor BamB